MAGLARRLTVGALVLVIIGLVPVTRTWAYQEGPWPRAVALIAVVLAAAGALLRWAPAGETLPSIVVFLAAAQTGAVAGGRIVGVLVGVTVVAAVVFLQIVARHEIDERAPSVGPVATALSPPLILGAIVASYKFSPVWQVCLAVVAELAVVVLARTRPRLFWPVRPVSPSWPTPLIADASRGARALVWWVSMVPICVGWALQAYNHDADPSSIPLAVCVVALLLVHRPRWVLPACLLFWGWTVYASIPWTFPIQLVVYVAAAGVVSAWALGLVETARPLVHRALVAFPIAATAAAHKIVTAQQTPVNDDINLPAGEALRRIPILVFLTFMVVCLVAPQVMWTAIGWFRPLRPLLTPLVWVLRTATRWADRVVGVISSWWNGDRPRLLSAAYASDHPIVEDPDVTPSRWWRGRPAVRLWVATFLLVNASRIVSPFPGRDRGWFNPSSIRDYLFSGELFSTWIKWDAGHYVEIAMHGYQYRAGEYVLADNTQLPMAWLPGMSLVMRVVSWPVHSIGKAAFGWDAYGAMIRTSVLVSSVSGLLASVLFWRWLEQNEVRGRARMIAICTLLWFPYSFMLYGSGFSDALFVAFVLGAFVMLGSGRPIVAGLLGGAASLVRISGLAVFVAFAVHAAADPLVQARFAVLRDRIAPGRWQWTGVIGARVRSLGARLDLVAAAALTFAGIGGYIVWCWIVYGEPLLYWNAHRTIFGSITLADADILKIDYFPSVARRISYQPSQMTNLLAAMLLTVFSLLSVPAVLRRFGAGAAAYVAATVAMIWFGSFDFIGAGRYLIAAFPVMALWAEWLARATSDGKWRALVPRILAAGGVAFTLLFTFLFTQTKDLGW